MSRRLELRLWSLILVITAKGHARTSQQCGSNQRTDHDGSNPACPLHARDKRSRRAKTTERKCDGGNSDISSVHETTSSTGKTLFLMT